MASYEHWMGLGFEAFKEEDFDTAIAHYTQALALAADDEERLEALTWRGDAWYGKGTDSYSEARADYQLVLAQDPECEAAQEGIHLMRLWDDSIAHLKKKEYEPASESLDELLEIDPGHAAAFNNRGLAKSNLDRYESAIEDYDEAIRLNLNYVGVYLNRGNAKSYLGHHESAIEDFDKAIRLNPDYAVAYDNRGLAKDNLGRYESAIQDFDEAIRLDPDYVAAYNGRGNARSHLGRYESSIEDYDEVIRLDPNNAFAYYNRGDAKSHLSRYESAIEDYDEAVRLNPDYAAAYGNRGIAKTDLGRYESAIEDYDEVIRLNPNDALAYYNRGDAKSHLGRYESAIEDYDEAIRLNPNSASAYGNRGIAKSDLDRYESAIEDYDEAIRLDPNYAAAYANRGTAKGNLGRYECAIEDFDEAIRLDPNEALAYNNRGNAKSYLGRDESAIEDYDEAIRLNPNSAFAYSNRGRAKSNLGHYESAIEDYDESIRLNPNHAAAYGNRGSANFSLDRPYEALFDYQKALSVQWDLVPAYENLAKVLRHFDDIAGWQNCLITASLLTQAQDFRRDGDLVNYAFYRAAAAELQGLDDIALAEYDRTLAASSIPDERILTARADLLRQMGRTEEALEGYQQALTQAPESYEAEAGLRKAAQAYQPELSWQEAPHRQTSTQEMQLGFSLRSASPLVFARLHCMDTETQKKTEMNLDLPLATKGLYYFDISGFQLPGRRNLLTLTVRTQESKQKDLPDFEWDFPIDFSSTGKVLPVRRIAMVVGNEAYEYPLKPLQNPVNDLHGMERQLAALGFDLFHWRDGSPNQNLGKEAFETALAAFRQKIESGGYDVALFYYAGHGCNALKANYLLPIVAPESKIDLHEEEDVNSWGIRLGQVIRTVKTSRTHHIIILDACREETIREDHVRGLILPGFTAPRPEPQLAIAFSTREGGVAWDKHPEKAHGLYTGELLDLLATPEPGLKAILDEVQTCVSALSDGKQLPAHYIEMAEELFLTKAAVDGG